MASPTVLIVGGPNGAGKTTLAEPYAEQKDRPYLAADRIASELNPEDPYAARVEAAGSVSDGSMRSLRSGPRSSSSRRSPDGAWPAPSTA